MAVQERRLTIPAVLERIEDACIFVNSEAKSAGLSKEAVYHCHLAIEEVLTNIVEHGYKYKGDAREIVITCVTHPDRFIMCTLDDAPPFDPLSLPDPNPKQPLIEREGGGWGIYFVKQYMDALNYRWVNGHNQFTMTKFIPPNSHRDFA
ncbi:ATP-binding protein [bacterium]|nr:ATP-binding protein [bacterium]